MKRSFAAAAMIVAMAAGWTGGAQAQDDILKHRIDDPVKDKVVAQGKGQKNSVVKSDGVPGGYAMRLKVAAKGQNPWDVAVESPVSAGGVKKGDVVLFAFWARAEQPNPGQINARVQQASAPYGAVVETSALNVGPDWKMYYVSGKSPLDASPGGLRTSLHLGLAEQTIDVGPSMVFDLGPDYPLDKLPRNR